MTKKVKSGTIMTVESCAKRCSSIFPEIKILRAFSVTTPTTPNTTPFCTYFMKTYEGLCQIGNLKVEVLRERLHTINPEAEIKAITDIYNAENADSFHLESSLRRKKRVIQRICNL